MIPPISHPRTEMAAKLIDLMAVKKTACELLKLSERATGIEPAQSVWKIKIKVNVCPRCTVLPGVTSTVHGRS